ncbi:MAG: hypothetical protein JSV84_10520 [Gemmatimonadota bacterium]|nr:MAG: hypothetical protein JSV84_10520 [Gemmatimonadota bacterium]
MLKRSCDVKVKNLFTKELFFILTLILFLLTQFNGCSQEDNASVSPLYQARENGSYAQDSILCSLRGETLFVTHQDAYYQCCLESKIVVHKTGFSIDLIEYDVGHPCDCMCPFDLTTAITGLSSGTYTIKVWNEYGGLYGECEATILKNPRLAGLSQSECLSYPKVITTASKDDSIVAVYENDTLSVFHFDAFYNCCFHIDVAFEHNGPILNFIEHPSGEPCRCMCYFNIASTVVGLAPGAYTVRVWNEDLSTLFGEVDITIQPELAAKTILENDDPSPSGPRWRYVSGQIGCKEYPKKKVQQK